MHKNCSEYDPQKQAQRSSGESKATIVAIITLITMTAEISAGILTGSMALLSDGIHMGTHAFALFITAGAYLIARRHRENPAFAFGTGKIGILGGYTNAILLAVAAILMIVESVERLLHPQDVLYTEALIVAVIGLVVNLGCALILGHHDHQHESNEEDHGDHRHAHNHHDHNLRGAYLHVITDALTSVLAIGALLAGKLTSGMNWLDPAAGILGAVVILKWSWGLITTSGALLLDFARSEKEIDNIRKAIEDQNTTINDIHIWNFSENDRSLIMQVETRNSKLTTNIIRERLGTCGGFNHSTIEIQRK